MSRVRLSSFRSFVWEARVARKYRNAAGMPGALPRPALGPRARRVSVSRGAARGDSPLGGLLVACRWLLRCMYELCGSMCGLWQAGSEVPHGAWWRSRSRAVQCAVESLCFWLGIPKGCWCAVGLLL